MPSGPKKRRAQKRKEEAAIAAREKSEKEESSKDNRLVMQTESTDGVTAVFDEPTVVLPKRTVLLDNIIAPEVFDLKSKNAEESIKENVLPTEILSTVQSLNVAEPFETSPPDKIDAVGGTSAVDAPCVIELDSQDKDGGTMMSPVCDFKEKVIEGIIGNPVPTETYATVVFTEPQVTSLADETDAFATDATELLQEEGGSIMVPDAFPIMMDNAIISLTTEPCDMDSVEFSAENAVLSNIDAAKGQKTLEHKEDTAVEKIQNLVTPMNGAAVENQETAAPNALEKTEVLETAAVKNVLNEVDVLEKIEESEQPDVVEVEAAILEDVDGTEKNSSEAVAENQETAANEVDDPEQSEAVEVDDVEAAVKETVILEGVNHIEKDTLEAVALRGKCETIPNNLETAKPAVDIIYQSHDAVSSELVTPGVRKQLNEVKEMVVDVLNRLNAIDALLHMN